MKRIHSLTKLLTTLTSGMALAFLVAGTAQAVTTSGKVVSRDVTTDMLTIQTDNGQRYTFQTNGDTVFKSEGDAVKLEDLQPGALITVTTAETPSGSTQVTTLVQVDQMAGKSPMVVAAVSEPEPSRADRLPSTATRLPLVALAGAASILAGIGLSLRRRQS
jgi:LPXTG cell wall anchor motif